eukprot:SAG31_NODE_2298_length_5984_cov_29.550476_6_plen_72_part_00
MIMDDRARDRETLHSATAPDMAGLQAYLCAYICAGHGPASSIIPYVLTVREWLLALGTAGYGPLNDINYYK